MSDTSERGVLKSHRCDDSRSAQKLGDRTSYFVAFLDWQHVRFPFEEMDLGAGNQAGRLLGCSTVEQLVPSTSNDECRTHDTSGVLRVIFEIRTKQLAVITQDFGRVSEISGQPFSILPKLEPHQPVVPGSAEQQRVFEY